MDVIVRNLHDQVTESQVRKFFQPHLQRLGIHVFQCQKLPSRGCATITIHDITKAQLFLMNHGQNDSERKHQAFLKVRVKLYHRNRPIYCCRSNKDPDRYVIQSLQEKENDRYAGLNRKAKIVSSRVDGAADAQEEREQRDFSISKCRIGQWSYHRGALTFYAHYEQERLGRIIFGSRAVLVKLLPNQTSAHQIEIPYDTIMATIVWSSPCSVTFSLREPPKYYEETGELSLTEILRGTVLGTQQFKRKRVSSLDKHHSDIVGHCFCYRFTLISATEAQQIRKLTRTSGIPDSVDWHISVVNSLKYVTQMSHLQKTLADSVAASLPFEVAYQLQRLAQNGYLPPATVSELIGDILKRLENKDNDSVTIASAIRHLAHSIPYAGPEVDANEFGLSSLLESYHRSEDAVFKYDPYSTNLATDHDHITLVYKAMVTPTAIILNGPEPETKNRVLRKYSESTGYFLSVSFADENGEPLRLDRQTSGEDIYDRRFKGVLNTSINIAGRSYEFLGFSHSSLREQTCWFMAPFLHKLSLIYAPMVIQDLGDFSNIRSPAKCAARIGQAFSQTLSAISVPPTAFKQVPDIERNGRTFSDGVGTCSQKILQMIWDGYTEARRMKVKPTILQIRYQVISLDERLQEEQLCLRPSMIKFHGSPDLNIEICGSARRALPMYLNRQLIKILEDLGVPYESFEALQKEAVEQLRITTLSPVNASTFLDRNHVSRAAHLPWLIRKLHYIDLDFSEDDFLRNTLELAVLAQLREIKYRSRILVKDGWTLYGIMDETGYLKENEIYCVVQMNSGTMQTLTGSVIITRCPALHPGDIQVVSAVDVPPDSALRALHNMVVFSSFGDRDLPSKLSGGDLDGDLYNIIWDHKLYPKVFSRPAEYETASPIDIQRPVERDDITNHFLTFMKNDNLGMIATLHQILADQSDDGTLDPQCIRVADLHSTAVDFSKSGIAVERKNIPKYPKARPDFQAPGPQVEIQKDIDLANIKENDDLDQTDEVDEVNGYGPPKIIYYESKKTLGKLYRAIDEYEFFHELQAQSRGTKSRHANLLEAVWHYVAKNTALIQWNHYISWAISVKENYEENLADTVTQSSPHPAHPINELEVFAGSILGNRGATSKRQREMTITMKDKFERDTRYITEWIRGGEGDDEDGALERSIACLRVGMNGPTRRRKFGTLRSFAWVAAAVCLKEVEKLVGEFGTYATTALSNITNTTGREIITTTGKLGAGKGKDKAADGNLAALWAAQMKI